jgi:8-oxo-dGTP pyrophosphatase MutT (NUDIX family)
VGSRDEIVVIVDAENRVVGAAPRWEMRARRLCHRSTYVLVFNPRGEVFVHKRTRTKDAFPGYWDPVAGGVVLAGESYEESAARELAEELGIRGVPLTPLFDFYYADARAHVWGRAFTCVWDGELRLQAEEIEGGTFMAVEEALRLAEREPVTPDGLLVLRRYVEHAPPPPRVPPPHRPGEGGEVRSAPAA